MTRIRRSQGARIPMTPRKVPAQERARATVEAILKATARVLVRDGYDAASTNRVAKEAGVSVGSLYQYFPNKEALVAAVIERHIEGLLSALEARLIELSALPVEEVVRELVHQLIESHRVNPKLHQVLIQQVPRIGKLSEIEAVTRRLGQLVCAYLIAHREELSVEDPELASFVIVRSAEALTHSVVLERPELLAGSRIEEEIARLVLGYLKPDAPSRGHSRTGGAL